MHAHDSGVHIFLLLLLLAGTTPVKRLPTARGPGTNDQDHGSAQITFSPKSTGTYRHPPALSRTCQINMEILGISQNPIDK